MKTRYLRASLFSILAVLMVFQFGCRSLRRGEPIQGEMKISDSSIAHGEKLFMEHCYQCHPNGEGGLGPSINDKPAPGFLVETQIRKGLGVMPSFTEKEISSEELDDLTEYVLALRRQDNRSAQR